MPGPTVMVRQQVDAITFAEISRACSVAVESIQDIYACTPLQVATIAESAIHDGASVFQFVLALSASIELDRFCNALQQVISLNPILRTRFVECRYGLLQVVIDETPCTLRPAEELGHYLSADKLQPMGLGAVLLRSAIIDRKLVLTVHHGIMDHASLTPLFDDVLGLYHGKEPKKRAGFKEFVTHCSEIEDAAAKEFWEPRFKGAPAVFPKVEPGYVPLATNSITRRIATNRTENDIPLAHVPSFLEAAWALTASTYAGDENVAFGLVLSGRNSASAAAESTLGPTIAIVPVQVNIKHDTTVGGILKDRTAARRQLQVHPALQYGLAKIRSISDAARVASGFQTLLNIRPRWYDPKGSDEIAFDSMDEPHGAFALVLSCDLEDTVIAVSAASDPKVLHEAQLDRILHQFEHYVQALMAVSRETKLNKLPRTNPRDFSELVEKEKARGRPATVEKCIHELFGAKAQEQPASAAIDAHDGSMSYAELDTASSRLAQELRRRGASVESPVAVAFEKSVWAVVSLLGVMKAGGCCVPISTSDPPTRKAAIVAKAAVKFALSSATQYDGLNGLVPDVLRVDAESMAALAAAADSAREEPSAPSKLAYILFTSGTTGMPKGVMLEHRNLASSLTCFIERFDWQPSTRTLHFASHVWDASVGEIFGTLLSGGCLCIPSDEDRAANLAGYINAKNVSSAWLTPTVIRTLSPDEVPCLKSLLSVGEAVSPEASKTWGKALRFFNGWGPCEASVLSAAAELGPDSPHPGSIGTPVNCSLWLVDPKNLNELAPIGAIGEVLIDGPGVARGYLNDDAKTKISFIKPPTWALLGEGTQRCLYRTGDMARYNADGSLSFIGRQDNQVKIRGQRFELGEVENVLASHSSARDVLTTTKIFHGRTELVAVVCLTDPLLPRATVLQDLAGEHGKIAAQYLRDIRAYARSRLPSYMVPTIWLAVERMPRTTSAKLDRVAIAQWLKTRDLASARAALEEADPSKLTPPCSEEEKLLRSVWASVLSIPPETIGRESCFGQLGGDSVLAMQVAGRSRRQGLIVTVQSLLKSTSLAAIAESCTQIKPMPAESGEPALQDGRVEEPVLLEVPNSLRARIIELSRSKPQLRIENIDAIVPATNGQTTMIVVGETGGRGYYVNFVLEFTPCLDLGRLHKACELVIQHHSILRTTFIQHGLALCQVILRDLPLGMVVQELEGFTPTVSFREGAALACFHLKSDGEKCQRLCLEIHHALYDALSLGLIFQDIDAAYAGRPLSDGPEFHSWVSHLQTLDESGPREFWKQVLQNSTMPFLAPDIQAAVRGHPLDESVRIRVPLANLKTAFGTPSSAVKAAWSLLLSVALDTRDVIFGEVSANRFLALPGIELVKGPCVNLVPVRAHLDPAMTLAALVAQIQKLSTDGMPHHHLGADVIIRDCTPWPSWARFSTAIVYQNHASLPSTLQIGDAGVALSNHGKLGDSTDVHIIAMPGEDDELELELRYSSFTIPTKQISWIAETLLQILNSFHLDLQKNLAEIEADLEAARGAYVPPENDADTSPDLPAGGRSPPSAQALEMVSNAWKELGLILQNERESFSMWNCGATLPTILLLSQQYGSRGYEISPEDIVQSPSNFLQASLLDLKIPKTTDATPPNGGTVVKEGNDVDDANATSFAGEAVPGSAYRLEERASQPDKVVLVDVGTQDASMKPEVAGRKSNPAVFSQGT